MQLDESILNTIIQAMPDALLLTDEGGTILFSNQQIVNLLGYSPEEISGKPIDTLMPERFRSSHAKHINEYNSNPKGRPMGRNIEIFAQHKSGNEIPVDICLSSIKNHQQNIIICVIRDITEIKKAIHEINSLQEILPICANCKKIKDDDGYWKQVEVYLSQHSSTKLSHGLCSDCKEELYGDQDWYKNSKR